MAERFGVLPSEILGLSFDEYLLNIRAFRALAQFEARQLRRLRRRGGK